MSTTRPIQAPGAVTGGAFGRYRIRGTGGWKRASPLSFARSPSPPYPAAWLLDDLSGLLPEQGTVSAPLTPMCASDPADPLFSHCDTALQVCESHAKAR